MSESTYPEFLKWGDYHSKDEKSQDVLNVELLEDEPFESAYSVNIRAKVDGVKKIIPLASLESKNKQLFKKFNDAKKNEKIQVEKKFKILTWLGTSKNGHPIRRFELVF